MSKHFSSVTQSDTTEWLNWLVSYCCNHKFTGLKQQIYYLTILEVRSLKWVDRSVSFWRVQGRICFPAFSSFKRLPSIFSFWPCITPTSASTETSPSLTLTLLVKRFLRLDWILLDNSTDSPLLKIINLSHLQNPFGHVN